ncbi:glycosyltransferase family 2 protein [bacterium]|nr:glycosyltransferase family 2 protein [bacterium]
MKISVAIITRDAAADLDRCLASLGFADEVVVLDQGSTDATAAVCARHGAALHQGAWQGFGPTKQAAVDLCRNRWVLSVDSDEEVTPELAAAIGALPEAPAEAAFAVNRLSRFLGAWIRHCGWHPDHVVRLFDRERAAFNAKPVHEGIETAGTVGRLPGLLRHYTYETMEQYVEKLNRYTTLAAAEMHAAGRRTSLVQAVVRAEATFWRMFVLQGGLLDGWHGAVLCWSSGFYVLAKYVKLWRLGRP